MMGLQGGLEPVISRQPGGGGPLLTPGRDSLGMKDVMVLNEIIDRVSERPASMLTDDSRLWDQVILICSYKRGKHFLSGG